MRRIAIVWLTGMGIALALTGCAHGPMEMDLSSSVARTSAMALPVLAPSYEPGSLWSTRATGSLFEDSRAREVGDLVMVRVVENASGAKDATTKSDRTTKLSTTLTSFFAAPLTNRNMNVGVSSEFDGGGKTARSGKLTALVAASVIERLSNGNLVIHGTREIQVNDEIQIIQLQGVVRPVDISTDNVVLSSRIADARITYTGTGVLDEKQRPGWFTRMFDYVTPF